jgi:hypothetical protein
VAETGNEEIMNDDHIQFLEEHLKKLERLNRILRGDHPDSITLTEAAESLEEKHLLPNLLNLSSPVTKQP